MCTQAESGLVIAFNSFREGNPRHAKTILESALLNELENGEIIFALKCANYWQDVFSTVDTLAAGFHRGELLLAQWSHFKEFIETDVNLYTQTLYAVKRGIFSLALENYQVMLNERDKSLKAEMFCRTGLCHKVLGDYETAIRFLQDANTLRTNSAAILAELGDCYALCGEEKTAKVLFREAFFIAPSHVDNSFLESELFCRLKERTAHAGYSGDLLQEWIPVYGVLFGVFNIKRELRALEAGKLKQAVFAFEKELKEEGIENNLLVPRLINHYFWLIDHYVATNSERFRINEILLKIKLLDSTIYDMYTV